MTNHFENVYAVIMAGGSGTRFWPLSREKNPKQILRFNGDNSMLRDTVDRLQGLLDNEKILIVTSQQQRDILQPHIDDIDQDNFIVEPSPRSTAPCIGLAAINILERDPDGIMMVFPADHRIQKISMFHQVLKRGIKLVNDLDPLVTIGIPPTRPETGYGYIQFAKDESYDHEGVYRVKTFAEKPNKATAERFVAAGDFCWNSGIFLFSAKRILAEMEEHLPEQYNQLMKIRENLNEENSRNILETHYNRCKAISIDYGIMEISQSPIYMLSGDFEWSDVGSWDELYRLQAGSTPQNVVEGDGVFIEADRNFIFTPGKLTAVIGLNDILVVDTNDATLVCPLDRAQDVKNIVERLRKFGKEKFI